MKRPNTYLQSLAKKHNIKRTAEELAAVVHENDLRWRARYRSRGPRRRTTKGGRKLQPQWNHGPNGRGHSHIAETALRVSCAPPIDDGEEDFVGLINEITNDVMKSIRSIRKYKSKKLTK